jgi:hypothetical protein
LPTSRPELAERAGHTRAHSASHVCTPGTHQWRVCSNNLPLNTTCLCRSCCSCRRLHRHRPPLRPPDLTRPPLHARSPLEHHMLAVAECAAASVVVVTTAAATASARTPLHATPTHERCTFVFFLLLRRRHTLDIDTRRLLQVRQHTLASPAPATHAGFSGSGDTRRSRRLRRHTQFRAPGRTDT